MTSEASDAPTTSATPQRWVDAVRAHLDELLLEQAHLEKKAAAGAVTFLFRLPLDARLHRKLSALAREELVHFERALRLLERRGVAFETQTSSGYAERLKKAIRRDAPARLVDELLVAAVIERRSHERMSMLAAALAAAEPEVARFYADLCPAEERHEELYVELAELVADAPSVRARHQEWLDHEAEVLAQLPFSPRLHGGLPATGEV
ncbi:MAG: tRNA isopentenyl-2-thiomethyl-A-37 hydroxylase MiaE [Planctomycetota bacterium]